MDKELEYRTIEAGSRADFRDRGSRFLAYAWPVTDAADIKRQLALLKGEHPKAVHHCYAWRLGTDGANYRANDDGEPAGSAGKPILGQIDSKSLTNLLVVVVRYFGGTLLGVPGLINAYKTATALALEAASIVSKPIETMVILEFNYQVMREVLYHLKQASATIYKQEMQLFCTLSAGIPKRQAIVCLAALQSMRTVTISLVD